MKWFHRKRLIRLADKLAGKGPYATVGPVPAHKFDMQHIFQDCKGGGAIGLDDFNPKHCKTAACALGWAESDRWFKKMFDDLDYFGISDEVSDNLFFAGAYAQDRHVKASVVAARLRKAADAP